MKTDREGYQNNQIEAGHVFQFCSSAYLEQLTGKKANSLKELLVLIESCSNSSVFYHTFSALRKLRQVHVPYTNDFAVWISRDLNEEALAEKLAAINLAECRTLENLKACIVQKIKDYVEEYPEAFEKEADDPFYLCDVTRIVYLTDKFAYDLKSFRQILESISVDSLYYHFIESRIQNESNRDDFSTWIDLSLHYSELAQRIGNLDITVYDLNELRAKIGGLIDEHTHKT